MSRLEGKVALVSGGARGMGAAHARGIVAEGGAVVIGDVLTDGGRQLADELGDRAAFVELDVRREECWDAAVGVAEATFGGLDILVNNAGVTTQALKSVADMELDEYLDVVAVNQIGVFLGMHACSVPIIRRGGGSIVNISSIAGLTGSAGGINYVASKFAVRGMTKCAALELAPFQVRVNSIHPGFINTPMLAIPQGVDLPSLFGEMVPLGRIADPSEVTKLVLFLASADAAFCTGAEFVIDGGQTCGIDSKDFRAVISAQLQAHLS